MYCILAKFSKKRARSGQTTGLLMLYTKSLKHFLSLDTVRGQLNYLQEVHRGRQFIPSPCPTLEYYILTLNPSAVSKKTASVVRPFQFAIVRGKKEFLKLSI